VFAAGYRRHGAADDRRRYPGEHLDVAADGAFRTPPSPRAPARGARDPRRTWSHPRGMSNRLHTSRAGPSPMIDRGGRDVGAAAHCQRRPGWHHCTERIGLARPTRQPHHLGAWQLPGHPPGC
jgi:hypothetical protein